MTDKIESLRRELEKQHREIKAGLERLDQLFADGSRVESFLRELEQKLRVLRGLLARHFEFEEGCGKFEDLVRAAPRLRPAVDELYADHRTLAEGLAGLCRESADAGDRVEGIVSGYRSFRAGLERHEDREMEAVGEAFVTDVGTGD